MKAASNKDLTEYAIYLSHDEAVELSEFLSKFGRPKENDVPCLEIRIAHKLYAEGLSKYYHEKWAHEYGS